MIYRVRVELRFDLEAEDADQAWDLAGNATYMIETRGPAASNAAVTAILDEDWEEV